MRLLNPAFLLLLLTLSACTRAAPVNTAYTPPALPAPMQNPSLPTGAPPAILTYLPPTCLPGSIAPTPTPNVPQILPTFTPRAGVLSRRCPPPPPARSPSIVQPGEYPGSIAAQYGIPVEELLNANGFGYDVIIYPGDRILISSHPHARSRPGPQPRRLPPPITSKSSPIPNWCTAC